MFIVNLLESLIEFTSSHFAYTLKLMHKNYRRITEPVVAFTYNHAALKSVTTLISRVSYLINAADYQAVSIAKPR